ncbi:MAG: hypothetical protein V4482_01365 [Pseudomonadota bacterium]
MLNLFFDVIMVGLLLAAIVFCLKLSGRLKTMRDLGAELSPFMKNMSGYLGQISNSIDTLKKVADLGNQGLNEHIPVAINLKEDFDLLLEHSDKMAKRLDEIIEKAREMDQRLQQTVRIAEGARSLDRRAEPVLQRDLARPAQNAQQTQTQKQAPFTKNNFVDEREDSASRSFILPSSRSVDDDVDFFVPSQARQRAEQKSNAEYEGEMQKRRPNPVERGIMAKLRGLR